MLTDFQLQNFPAAKSPFRGLDNFSETGGLLGFTARQENLLCPACAMQHHGTIDRAELVNWTDPEALHQNLRTMMLKWGMKKLLEAIKPLK
jgi:hypothetical protein